MAEEKGESGRIEPSFRGGTVTTVGIMLAFSMGFLTAWGANPVPWELQDSWAIGPIAVGIVFQFIALSRLLSVRSLEAAHHRISVRIFLVGLICVVTGVCAALVVDLFWIASHRQAI